MGPLFSILRVALVLYVISLRGLILSIPLPPCHRSLISGVETDLDYSSNSDLTCKDTNKEIVLGAARYLFIHCDPTTGWMDETTRIAFANTSIYVRCEPKGPCNEDLIEGYDTTMTYNMNDLKCKDDSEILVVYNTRYSLLHCDRTKGWMDGNNKVANSDEEIIVECKKKACSEERFSIYDQKTMTYLDNELKCDDYKSILKIEGNMESEKVSCSPIDGTFSANDLSGIESVHVLNTKCVEATCSVKKTEGDAKFNAATSELKCEGDEKIILDYKIYDNLKCTKLGGWENGGIKVKNAEDIVKTRCANTEACHIDLIERGKDVLADSITNTLSCPEEKRLDVQMPITYNKLVCDPSKGWMDGNTIIMAPNQPFSAECISIPCANHLVVYGPGVIHRLPDEKTLYKHLECEKPGSEFLYIEPNFYENLQCDPDLGWKMNNKLIGKGPLELLYDVQCRPKNCDRSFIKGLVVDGVMLNVAYNGKELKCLDGLKLRINNGALMNHLIECDRDENQWMIPYEREESPNTKRIVKYKMGLRGDEFLHAECVKTCRTSLDELAVPEVELKEGTGYKELRCVKQTKYLRAIMVKTTSATRRFEVLFCNELDSWEDQNGNKIAPSDVILEVSCTEYCEIQQDLGDTVVEFVQERNNIKLFNNKHDCALSSSIFSNLVGPLFCSLHGGWSDINGQLTPVTEEKFEVKCEKRCTVKSLTAGLLHDEKNRKLSCPSGKTLLVKNTRHPEIQCDPYSNWFRSKDPKVVIGKADVELEASCIDTTKACINFKKPTYQARPEGVVSKDLPDGRKLIACDKNVYSKVEANSLRVAGVMVYSALTCDAADGYLDVAGKKWAESDEEIELDCKPSTCEERQTTYCDERALPKGYKCASKYRPFKSPPTDPNVLSCDEKNNELFLVRDSLFDGKLRCNQDGSWYKVGDSSGIPAIPTTGIANVMCIRNLCSSCTEMSALNSGTKPKFTPGTPKTCAKIECPEKLWRVAMHSIETDYVGTVTCSWEKDNTWTLKNGESTQNLLPREIATCVEEVRCSQITPLKSSCDILSKNMLNGVKCEKIIQDSEPRCPHVDSDESKDKMKMLYILRNEMQIESEGEYLDCDKKSGKWKITKSDGQTLSILSEGANVVCVDSEPPPYFTDARTACGICKGRNFELFKCNECSEHKTDIQLSLSKDKKTCIVKSSQMEGKFQTDQGLVVGPLTCNISDAKWMGMINDKFTEIKQFAAYRNDAKSDDGLEDSLIILIVLCSVSLLIFVIVIIFKVAKARRHPIAEGGNKNYVADSKTKKINSNTTGENDGNHDEAEVEIGVEKF